MDLYDVYAHVCVFVCTFVFLLDVCVYMFEVVSADLCVCLYGCGFG